MVEKLTDKEKIFYELYANKINELIDAHNKLEEKFKEHTHTTEDGVGPTSGPYSI